MSYRPELLSPAGEFASVIGAINAGADAVYIGASLYSARAFAKNFTEDEIIKAIEYTHLHGKKLYIALNILLKNTEIYDAIDILKVPYENGLDGVIVHDMGLISLISKIYPDLPIHASTQLSIMSSESIDFLKKYNISRVVPARELSIDEIANIKAKNIEVECFIHGAMCYSYSGKCLFSSIAGGRSGNRGRCAGPCRKPYVISDNKDNILSNECYPISMKDMCAITSIDKLMDAKVDSFKIEGRMKSPEYCAGVTAIYRKYIDMYLEKGSIKVSDKDLKMLHSLYIRSEIEEGYLNKHNGKEMITINKPSYIGISDNVQKGLFDKYIKDAKCIGINMYAYIHVGEPFILTISCDSSSITYEGPVVDKAIKKALSEDDIAKQLGKLGNTFYALDDIVIDIDEESFLPVSTINDIRRNAINMLTNELIGRKVSINSAFRETLQNEYSNDYLYTIGITNKEQLEAIDKFDFYDNIIFDIMSFNVADFLDIKKDIYIRLPDIIREKSLDILKDRIKEFKNTNLIKGIYVSSVDGLSLALNEFDKEMIHCDSGVYVFNELSEKMVLDNSAFYTAQLELNDKELRHFHNYSKREMQVYGYIPLMRSANCILKTIRKCDASNNNILKIVDDKRRAFPVTFDHVNCFNTIYNYLPTNLINELNLLINNKSACNYRIEFTVEDYDDVMDIMSEYESFADEKMIKAKENSYTLGHFRRGVD